MNDKLIHREPFRHLVRTIIRNRDKAYLCPDPAMDIIRHASEFYIFHVLEDSSKLSVHGRRITITAEDISLTLEIRENLKR